MNTSKEKNLKDEIVATRANYDTAVNAAKALDAVKAIDDDCCTADYEKATEAAKDIDAARESARNDIREALCAAALDAYNDYTAD